MSEAGANAPVPVVVGLDGSADAHRAVEWAAHVAAGHPEAVLHLVHALALPVVPLFHAELTVEELFARQEREALALLDGERTRLAERGLRAEVVLRRWLPAETLIEHANECHAGLILVGQHGRGHGRRLLGSVSGAVARGARQPVVVVRGERDLAGMPRRVLLAVDRSAGAAAAAAALAAWLPASEVIAVEVVSDQGEAARTRLESWLAERALAGARTTAELATGDVAEQLLALARELEVDLLAAGRRGRSGWQELLVGGVSEKLLQLAPCPVLLAH